MRPTHRYECACWLVFGVLVLGVLAACTSGGRQVTPAPTATLEPSLEDRSLLTDTPCPAPCWYGLQLGRSTKAEVLATARHLSFVDRIEFPEGPYYYWDQSQGGNVPGTLVSLQCRQPAGQTCAALLFVDDILKQIYLSVNYPLDFAQVVDHFGAPEYVQVFPRSPDGPMQCNIALIWKQRGIRIVFLNGVPAQDQVQCAAVRGGKGIRSDLPVEQILYALPSDTALINVPQAGGDFPWSGFAEP
jgi:hypothetical protein